MNEDLVLAITMLIILAVVVLFIQISQQIKVKRIQKMKIQRRFGEIPDMEEVLPIEKISVYHKHQGREDVDQVLSLIHIWMTILGDKAQTLDETMQDVLLFLPKIFGKKMRTIVLNKSCLLYTSRCV